jgi:hypothetical protein
MHHFHVDDFEVVDEVMESGSDDSDSNEGPFGKVCKF